MKKKDLLSRKGVTSKHRESAQKTFIENGVAALKSLNGQDSKLS